MKKALSVFGAFILVSHFSAAASALTLPPKQSQPAQSSSGSLRSDEIDAGLKQALAIGIKNATALASQVDGFYKNPLIFIPWPPEAEQMKTMLLKIGLQQQVEKLVMTLNRAAEESAKRAAPIFFDALKGLTIQDGIQILRGSNDAATQYLKRKTHTKLLIAFRPEVKKAMDKVEVTKYWKPLVTQYNRIPFMQPVSPNLENYVTDRAVGGLFKLLANEEKKIRQNPAARVTDIMQRVFGADFGQ